MTHWTEMEPEENEGTDEVNWIECPICGYEYDSGSEYKCPNCLK